MYDNKKVNQIKGIEVFAGIDIGKTTHNLGVINNYGEVISSGITIDCSRKGFEHLEKVLGKMANKEKMAIGFEPTGHYWKNLGYYLENRGYKTFLISPYHVKLSKEMRDNSPRKTDKKDGLLIAHLLREAKFLNTRLLKGVYEDLRRLTNLRSKLVKELVRSKIRLRATLDEYLPEYSNCFSSIAVKTSLALLKKYSLKELRSSSLGEKIIKDIRKVSRGAISKERANQIAFLLATSIGTQEGVVGAQAEVKVWIKQIENLQEDIAALENQIYPTLLKTKEAVHLLSIKGVGKITTATILGQTGSFSDFSNAKKLEKLAGLDLVENSSGQKQGLKRISKRGRDQLRCALFKVAIIAIAKNKEIKQFYDYKVNILKKEKMVALTDITVKLLRIMFGLVKNKSMYKGSLVLQGLPVLEARGH